MEIHEFENVYRRYAYPLYREVFEELKNIEETREVVYQVFSRIREEEPEDIAKCLMAYKMSYVAAQKKARLAIDRVWYQMQSDAILGRTPQERLPIPLMSEGEPEGAAKISADIVSKVQAEVAAVESETQAEEAPVAESEMPTEEGSAAEPEVPAEEGSVAETEAQAEGELAIESEASIHEWVADRERLSKKRKIREVYPDEESQEDEDPENEGMAAEEEKDTEDPGEEGARSLRWLNVVGWILLIVAVIAFLWIFVNVLMSAEIIPFQDWGYRWFNDQIAPIFPIFETQPMIG